MRTYRKIAGVLALGALGTLGFSPTAMAAGVCVPPNVAECTAADTPVINQATLDYSVGGVPQTQLDSDDPNVVGAANPTEFRVDQELDINVNEVGGAYTQVTPGSAVPAFVAGVAPTNNAVVFDVVNEGNSIVDVLLAAFDTTLDPFSGPPKVADGDEALTDTEIWVDTDGDNLPDVQFAGATLQNAFVDNVPIGATRRVWVLSSINNTTALQDETLAVSLVGQVAAGGTAGAGAAINNDQNGNISPADGFGGARWVAGTSSDVADTPLTVDNVFSDNDSGGATTSTENLDSTGAAADAANNGQASDADAFIVIDSNVVLTKTSLVTYDPININTNPKAIPGARVQYTITIDNSAGSADATNIVVQDVLSAAQLAASTFTTSGGAPASATLRYDSGSGYVTQTLANDTPAVDVTGGGLCAVDTPADETTVTTVVCGNDGAINSNGAAITVEAGTIERLQFSVTID